MHLAKLHLLLCATLTSGGCKAPSIPCFAGIPPPRKELRAAAPVLHSLARERQKFLQSGDPGSVFAVFYYHVTAAILQRAGESRLPQSRMVLELLREFHSAYTRSRHPDIREVHWRPYYEKAATLSSRQRHWADIVHPGDFLRSRGLLALGVQAHIDVDLPLCTAAILERHPEVSPEIIETAFRSLDDLFDECAAAGFADLATMIPDAPGPRIRRLQSHAALMLVRSKRHRAWRMALSMAGSSPASSTPEDKAAPGRGAAAAGPPGCRR